MFFLFRKSLFFPTIITILMVATSIFLGIWQVKRLVYKQDLLQQIEENYFLEPIDIGLVEEELNDDALSFLHVKLKGVFLPEYKVFIASKMHEEQLGYHLMVPFKTNTGIIMWINLGWVPRFIDPAQLYFSETGVHITGHIYHPDKKRSSFIPENPKQIGIKFPWYSFDLKELNEVTGLNAVDQSFVFLDTHVFLNKKEGYIYPVPDQLKITIPNNHLEYLITWFSFAIIFIVMYVIYVVRHKKA